MSEVAEPKNITALQLATGAIRHDERFQSSKLGVSADIYGAVYTDLKRMAQRQLSRQSPYTDLSATVLLHESYARAANLDMPSDRSAFFSYAARAMRSVIVDYVRARQRSKRNAVEVSLTLDDDIVAPHIDLNQIISVDRALSQLRAVDQRAHDLVELHYFAGFSLDECAEQLGVSGATVTRDWKKARAFLRFILGDLAT